MFSSYFSSSGVLCVLLLYLVTTTTAINTIKTPIIKNALNVHTRILNRIPIPGEEKGKPPKIVCLIPNGPDMYVCTLKNIYRLRPDGTHTLFMDVSKAVQSATGRSISVSNGAHGGVRSIAFHPNFRKNGLFYISAMEDRPSNPSAFRYVSRLADGRTPIPVDSVLLEFRVNLKTGTPISSSYRNLFRVEVFEFDHPIKQIAFSGMFLYIAHGDGSSPTDVSGTGMENDALGKILRINPLKSKNSPYTIPKSNPFLGSNRFPDETWAVGFRNPHHLCFSRNGTLFSAESGHDNVEEINIILPGKNYGWANREGTFVHLDRGGVLNGIKPLPMQDAKNKFEYPVIQLGHEGDRGEIDSGEAIAGACPVENSSPMGGKYFYADFPRTGNLYFSNLDEIFAATTRGDPKRLKQARTRQAVIFFDHDNNENTPPLKLNSLGDVLRSDPDFRNQDRVDVRFGRTSNGYLYWSSKRNGRIYLFTSSVPGGPGGVP